MRTVLRCGKPVIIAAFFVILFNILMASALYMDSRPGAASTQPSTKGEGEAFYAAAAASAPSGGVSTLAATGPESNGPYEKVVNVVMQAGAVTDQSYSQFYPNVVTVVMGVNNTVTFPNQDTTAAHTVASYSVPPGASAFSSGVLKLGATYSVTFGVRGTYYYDCTECPWMTGVIVVK